jgi:predicted HicB family RNase H-like nuclease
MPDPRKPPTFTHKGYTAAPEWDADDAAFHGRIDGIRDVVTFEGATLDEARQAFADSVDDYLAFCVERGAEPGKPEEVNPDA